jgi:hypothetical protein
MLRLRPLCHVSRRYIGCRRSRCLTCGPEDHPSPWTRSAKSAEQRDNSDLRGNLTSERPAVIAIRSLAEETYDGSGLTSASLGNERRTRADVSARADEASFWRAASISVIGQSVVTESLQIDLDVNLRRSPHSKRLILLLFLVAREGAATTFAPNGKASEFNGLIATGVRI